MSWPLLALENLLLETGITQQTLPQQLTPQQTTVLRRFVGVGEDEVEPKKLALLSFLQLYLSLLPRPVPMRIHVRSALPTGAGLGSSAAYAVCLSAALLRVAGQLGNGAMAPLDEQGLAVICRWALASEQVVHGTPSGIDNTTCTYGGAVSFKAGVSTAVAPSGLRVLLVNTRVPRSTKALVSGVWARREKHTNAVDHVLDAIDAIASEGLQALQKLSKPEGSSEETHDAERTINTLGELVEMNHALLCALGVSHPSLERLVAVAKEHQLRAKLTGAGGGGFGLVLLNESSDEDDVAQCKAELLKAGYDAWETSLGAKGVTIHES